MCEACIDKDVLCIIICGEKVINNRTLFTNSTRYIVHFYVRILYEKYILTWEIFHKTLLNGESR